jgi:hypothetical protein
MLSGSSRPCTVGRDENSYAHKYEHANFEKNVGGLISNNSLEQIDPNDHYMASLQLRSIKGTKETLGPVEIFTSSDV